MDNYNYPIGADNSTAPWNEKTIPEKEIEVTVSITLSKTVKVKVSDYKILDSGKDEEGRYFEDIDYSECDLEKAVKEQIILPNKSYNYIVNRKAYNDMINWNVDDFEVVLE